MLANRTRFFLRQPTQKLASALSSPSATTAIHLSRRNIISSLHHHRNQCASSTNPFVHTWRIAPTPLFTSRCSGYATQTKNEDFYTVLGVSQSATQKEIKRAYFVLAKKHHPDLNQGNPSATQMFQKLSEAYSVIGNEENRKKYDTIGHQQYTQSDTSNVNWEETFRSTWDENGVDIISEYVHELGAEAAAAVQSMIQTGNTQMLRNFLRHRSVFLILTLAPLVLVLRFPALIAMSFRLLMFALMFGLNYLPKATRNRYVGYVWNLLVQGTKTSNHYHAERKQQQQQQQPPPQQQQQQQQQQEQKQKQK